jgi:polysaccharide pyruvyl transferase WcaK-like protein
VLILPSRRELLRYLDILKPHLHTVTLEPIKVDDRLGIAQKAATEVPESHVSNN